MPKIFLIPKGSGATARGPEYATALTLIVKSDAITFYLYVVDYLLRV